MYGESMNENKTKGKVRETIDGMDIKEYKQEADKYHKNYLKEYSKRGTYELWCTALGAVLIISLLFTSSIEGKFNDYKITATENHTISTQRACFVGCGNMLFISHNDTLLNTTNHNLKLQCDKQCVEQYGFPFQKEVKKLIGEKQ